MESRISLFNYGIFKKNLQRFWLLPLAFFLFLYLSVISPCLNAVQAGVPLSEIWIAYILSLIFYSFFFGGVAAYAVFAYLYKSNSAYTIHALPVSRKSLFITNYVSGLVMLLGTLLISCVLLIVLLALNNALTSENAWLLLRLFTLFVILLFFFFSFGVLCAMMTGHILVMPVLYVILNFTAVVVEVLLRLMAGTLIYGLVTSTAVLYPVTLPFSPVAFLIENSSNVNFLIQGNGGWLYFIVLLVVSVIFIILSWLLYRSRQLESAGNVISHSFLKPVFKYCFTFGCAIVLGSLFYVLLYAFYNSSTSSWYYLFCIIAGAFIGYFLAEMMLRKTFRVFKVAYKGFIASVLVILALFGVFRFDLFNVASYVPKVGDIEKLTVYTNNFNRTEEEEAIQIAKWLQVHQTLINEEASTKAFTDRYKYQGNSSAIKWSNDIPYSPELSIDDLLLAQYDESYESYAINYVTFRYYLKDGSTIVRSYDVPVSELLLANSNSSAYQINAIVNSGEEIIYREKDIYRVNIDNCVMTLCGVEISKEDAAIIHNAIKADMEEGNICKRYMIDGKEYCSEMTQLWINIDDDGYYMQVYVLTCSENTIEALVELGLLSAE